MDGWMCVSVRTNANKSVNDFSLSLTKSDLWADRERDRQTDIETDKLSKHLHCNFKWTRIALWHIYPIPPSPHLMRSTEVAPKIKIQIPRLKAARNTWLAFSWKALQAVWSELRDFSAKAQGLPTNKDNNSSNNRSDNNNKKRVKPQLEADKMFYKKTLRLLSCCGALLSPQITSKATTATIITTMRELRNVVSSCLQFLARIVAREEGGEGGRKKAKQHFCFCLNCWKCARQVAKVIRGKEGGSRGGYDVADYVGCGCHKVATAVACLCLCATFLVVAPQQSSCCL